jgi:hypothetical protein
MGKTPSLISTEMREAPISESYAVLLGDDLFAG